uniref:Saccharopine dehydrogenase-like oxidoreductase n=1 Tax=Sinocyclocheilus rhinocerous TaxID=307959 RepID=A0A673IR43_9TELE
MHIYRPYHIIIFGASGFTGQFVVEEVARTASEGPKGNLKWAVAGRNRTKLEKVVEQAAGALSKPELKSEVDILVADVSDPDSLAVMCKQAVIVLSCVGPYRFFGEPVVKSCVENGTHCIDISGEPQFLERMQLNYHDQAAEKGVYIVGSCGFDSIPADMGVIYTRDQFKGTLTSIESFLTASAGTEGGCIHDGTWQSAIYGLADGNKLRSLRKKFGHKPLPVVGAKIKRRGTLFYSNELQQYAIPFMGSDPSVVKRTQRFLNEELTESPVQYGAYVGVGGISNIFKLVFAGLMFFFLVKFSFGRNLLIKFPEFFSFGFFSKEGPTRKQVLYPHYHHLGYQLYFLGSDSFKCDICRWRAPLSVSSFMERVTLKVQTPVRANPTARSALWSKDQVPYSNLPHIVVLFHCMVRLGLL